MNNSEITVDFKLLENNKANDFFIAEIVINNKSSKNIKSWKLCFDHFRPSETAPLKILGDSCKYGKHLKNIGEYNEIQGLTPLLSMSSITLKITGNWIMERYTDTPSCYFLVTGDDKIIPAPGFSDLNVIEQTCNCNKKKVAILPESNQLRLIPAPSEANILKGEFDFSSIDSIENLNNSSDVSEAIKTFINNYRPLINKEIKIVNNQKVTNTAILIKSDSTLPIDAYNLEIKKDAVKIKANSKGGYLYALISLFKLAESYNNVIPCVSIKDAPRFAYRGTLLDVARNFRPVPELKKYLTMLALNKVNVLHCRMTDDEGWRLEIKKFPNIAKIGGYRGYDEILPPFHGSGGEKTGGYYSHEEMTEIIDHANSLNITFLPEIVVPSHSRAILMSFTDYNKNGNPLLENEDKSEYLTAQNFTDNIMNPALDFTYTVLEAVYSEIASLFNAQKERKMPFSDYIHVGVDEVPEGAWMKSPVCKVLMNQNNLTTTEELQFYFINKIQQIVNKLGYKIAGWEEIVNGGTTLDKDLLVYSWKGEEAGFKAANEGFPVIMTPAQYLYFDLAYSAEAKEPGLYWAGYNNPKVIYSYYPFSNESNDEIKKNVKGIQACLWSENLGYPRRTNTDKLPPNYVSSPYEYMAFPKMTAFSEVAWTENKNRNWDNFVSNYYYEKKILDKFNIKYRPDPIE
jgi:hexosaminidase